MGLLAAVALEVIGAGDLADALPHLVQELERAAQLIRLTREQRP
jgi:hypothetical protein